MANHCHHHGCATSAHESHDHHHCCCCEGTCTHHHHHEGQDFAHQLLEMADEAWMEVLKDKIKQQIVATYGKNLDKLAKIVSDSNRMRWKNKLGLNKNINEFKVKIAQHFEQEK